MRRPADTCTAQSHSQSFTHPHGNRYTFPNGYLHSHPYRYANPYPHTRACRHAVCFRPAGDS